LICVKGSPKNDNPQQTHFFLNLLHPNIHTQLTINQTTKLIYIELVHIFLYKNENILLILRNKSFSKLSSESKPRLGAFGRDAIENILSTSAEEGRGVLNFANAAFTFGYLLSISKAVDENKIAKS